MEKEIKELLELLTEERRKKLLEKVKLRTKFITLVIEDVYQPHNASAILRTADAFGIQEVIVIERENKFEPSKGVSLGAEKWIEIKRFKKAKEAFDYLKSLNYKILVTVPPKKGVDFISLENFYPQERIALVFGSELKGVSDFWFKAKDNFLTIPIRGFVESFNVSVSVGIILYDLTQKLKNKKDFYLSPKDQEKLLKNWLKNLTTNH